ncbi:MAG: hypothetical protein IJ325_03105 [Clostridia bacterium]|nr:hypothetical protein [Clostridia bacterium]
MPLPFLTYVVGGMEIPRPWCEEIRITPRLGNLNHVKIAYPTPYGILYVEHTKSSDGRVLTKTLVPDGVKITE